MRHVLLLLSIEICFPSQLRCPYWGLRAPSAVRSTPFPIRQADARISRTYSPSGRKFRMPHGAVEAPTERRNTELAIGKVEQPDLNHFCFRDVAAVLAYATKPDTHRREEVLTRPLHGTIRSPNYATLLFGEARCPSQRSIRQRLQSGWNLWSTAGTRPKRNRAIERVSVTGRSHRSAMAEHRPVSRILTRMKTGADRDPLKIRGGIRIVFANKCVLQSYLSCVGCAASMKSRIYGVRVGHCSSAFTLG